MKYSLLITGLYAALSLSAQANTAINCYEVDEMEAEMIEVCVEQTDRHLNENYQQLRELHKDTPEKLELLKQMQLGWIQMRDAQCEFAMRNTGSNAALAGAVCRVKITQQRADELEEMTQ